MTKESVRNSEAGQSIQAAIQARFVAQNSVLVAKFEDIITKEEDKLPPLIRISTKMQFVKYKTDFYAKLQKENMANFEKLRDLYLNNIMEIMKNEKLTSETLDKLVKES